VPIASELSDDFLTWRQVSQQQHDETKKRNGPPPSDPEPLSFRIVRGSFMDSSNYSKRILHRFAKELELQKLTFQVIRRMIATLGEGKGHVKDIRGIMRHTKASTTTDVYMQSLEPEVRTAINSI
jgi:integrase